MFHARSAIFPSKPCVARLLNCLPFCFDRARCRCAFSLSKCINFAVDYFCWTSASDRTVTTRMSMQLTRCRKLTQFLSPLQSRAEKLNFLFCIKQNSIKEFSLNLLITRKIISLSIAQCRRSIFCHAFNSACSSSIHASDWSKCIGFICIGKTLS